jgi:glycosyltransferase involved in cell wall biosynthesis
VHIGLNLVFLVPGSAGGMETYARELIPELVAAAPDHRFTAFVSREAAAADGPWRTLTGTVTVPVNARRRVEWVRGEQQLLPRLAHHAGIDVLHSFASTAPGWGRFRRVVTIHDLIYRTVPEAHPGIRALGMRVLVPLGAWRAHRIIAISQTTRDDIVSHLRVRPDRVDVVPQGLGLTHHAVPTPADELRRRLTAGNRPLLLSVSAKLAHKNLERLLGALALLPAGHRPLLVLPGYPTPHEDELRRRSVDLGVEGDVRFLGWVSDAELEGLYAAAVGFVFPSLAEGFGLPVLEAMARGVPVACSGRGALGEVAGDAALLFNPLSERSIADAIRDLLGDRALAERLAAAGRARAGTFSWSRTAAQTLQTYDRALT